MPDKVYVEALKNHARPEIRGRADAGDRYQTTIGRARRRVRHGLVEIVGAPKTKTAAPENKAVKPDLEDKAATPAITSAAAELADEEDVELEEVEGTGKDGKILKADVEKQLD